MQRRRQGRRGTLLGSREDWDQSYGEEHGYAHQRILHYGSAAPAARPAVAGRFSSTNFVSSENKCCRVVPPEIEWLRFGYTISENGRFAATSALTIASVFWKCTLSSPEPCTISNRPFRFFAYVSGEPLSYPAALSCGRPL